MLFYQLINATIHDNKTTLVWWCSISYSICNRFENVTEKVSYIPDTTSDLVFSIDFVNRSQTESLPLMMEEVNLAGRRLLMLLNYTIFHSKLAILIVTSYSNLIP